MDKKKIAVISVDDSFVTNVKGTLDKLSYEFDLVSKPTDAKEVLANGHGSVLFDEAFDEAFDCNLLGLAAKNSRNIICTDGDEKETIRILRDYSNVMHVFGKNKPYYDVELTTALHKITNGTIGSIEQYLDPGKEIHSHVLTSYGKKDEYLEAIHSYANRLRCFPDFPDMVATVTWELVMNAMFDAPYDYKEGRAKYYETPRTKNFEVGPGEEVMLSYGHDDRSFAVSVADNFGRLTRDIVVDNLVRASIEGSSQIKRGASGAGVGLYLLFNNISQINFNIIPGSKTEVIFVVFLSRRLKDFVLRARSINFFVDEEES